MSAILNRHADLENGTLVRDMAGLVDRLIATIDPNDLPSESYRKLLENALGSATEAQRRLIEQTREIERLRRLSVTDEMTGILNRRGFNESLERALARVRRGGETGYLMLIDLDGFKAINDTHGHQAGDLVLASIATVLTRNTRMTDSVARLGGDEFAVILADANPEMGLKKAEALEEALNRIEIPWNGTMIPVGASVGIVGYAPDDMPEELIRRADARMYKAKRTAFIPARR